MTGQSAIQSEVIIVKYIVVKLLRYKYDIKLTWHVPLVPAPSVSLQELLFCIVYSLIALEEFQMAQYGNPP